jgi:hypothetical protein
MQQKSPLAETEGILWGIGLNVLLLVLWEALAFAFLGFALSSILTTLGIEALFLGFQFLVSLPRTYKKEYSAWVQGETSRLRALHGGNDQAVTINDHPEYVLPAPPPLNLGPARRYIGYNPESVMGTFQSWPSAPGGPWDRESVFKGMAAEVHKHWAMEAKEPPSTVSGLTDEQRMDLVKPWFIKL